MKIVQQKTLFFSEGKSDKVYEVDLCESGSDLFIVNFRYGRRGANLREGTKTVFPISYDEAVKVFDKLVLSKEKKGYSETLNTTSSQDQIPIASITLNVGREETILKYLKDAVTGVYTRDWKVSRIIFRAYDLNIVKAIPLITHFIQSTDRFEQYASIYALSKFKDISKANEIYSVFQKEELTNNVGRIAAAYTLKLGSSTSSLKILSRVEEFLPNDLKELKGDNHSFFNGLSLYLLRDKEIDASILYYIYLTSINDEFLRELLYQFIEKAPLKVNVFKSIRYIYRAADILEDTSFLALTSKRIAVSKPGYVSSYLYVNGEWSTADVEKTKKNPSIAFSKKTKDYFNKTIYKYVYKLGEKDKENYIKYASALLISLNDLMDNVSEDVQYNYSYDSVTRQYITEKRCFPKYHEFLALMYIVYGNSNRLQNQNNKKYYIEGSENLNTLLREEIFSELWDSKPAEVVHILANAKSELTVDFCLRIIKENAHFLDDLSVELLTRLVSHYNPKVLDVVLVVIEIRYASTKPEATILLALLRSKHEKANELAFNWLNKYEKEYFSETAFIGQLILTGSENVIQYLKTLYIESVIYGDTLSLLEIESLFRTPSIYSVEYLLSVNELIGNTYFGKLLSTVVEEKIKELASSSLTINKLFAANLAKQNIIETYQLFKEHVDDYINSENKELRKVGIELLSHFPDEFLLEHHNKINGFCFSEYDEVREAIQPTVERLIGLDEKFKNSLFKSLLRAVNSAETYDGLHINCYSLLNSNYKNYLSSVPQERIFDLILSKYEYAQKIGESLFVEHIGMEELSVKDIVRLADSDIFTIRTRLKTYFEGHPDKININLEEALLVFNSNWDDMIDWGCQYFEDHIKPENWNVNMLLYACDHTKTEVQHFGRKMITKYFTEDKGLPLLLKLQEHPTKAMQFFVTNYLDNYAKDNIDVILKLETFFKTSLFNINSNRVTKTRIYTFLEQESLKNKEIAQMTVRLIESILGTRTKTDNSNNIDVLLSIAEAHPDIEVPLLINHT